MTSSSAAGQPGNGKLVRSEAGDEVREEAGPMQAKVRPSAFTQNQMGATVGLGAKEL